MKMRVAVLSAAKPHPAIALAKSELIEHLGLACRKASFTNTRSWEQADFVLAEFDALPDAMRDEEGLSNDRWLDRVIVRSHGQRLILAGSNPRSVLFAVYTYLDEIGFAWTVPGEEGRVVPRLGDVPREHFCIDHSASLIYRGLGLTGAYSGEMGEQFIQWMARNRLNYFFLEGASGRKRYENHFGRSLSAAEVRRLDARLARAARQRGLLREMMGHGWTAQVLGLGKKSKPTDEHVAMAAELDGKRVIIDQNTQLCLSNDRASQAMIDHVTGYARKADLDVIGVWMADGYNNWCECARCAAVHPSDLWVRLINRIADALHEVRPDMRVEVLAYAGLIEPPPTERIDNRHGNVIFMFAPFLRCYLHTLDDRDCQPREKLKTFPPANRMHHPVNGEYFPFLQGWLKRFTGTNYIFDYYGWLPIKRDFFEGNVPRTLCLDLNRYPKHGVTGLVDCARAQWFWPTPLGRWMQARGSWDASVDHASEHDRLLELVYGPHAPVVDQYLSLAYDCLLPERHGREEERGFDRMKVTRFKRALPAVERKLTEAVAGSRGALRRMLQRVVVHAQFTRLHLEQLLTEAAGEYDRSIRLATDMRTLADKHRSLLAGFADPPEFDWLKRDTHDRLERKKAGTWRRID